MTFIISIMVLLTLLSVGFILLFGLVNMSRNGAVNLSQQLMRWRVGMQFIAVCVIMASFYFGKAQ